MLASCATQKHAVSGDREVREDAAARTGKHASSAGKQAVAEDRKSGTSSDALYDGTPVALTPVQCGQCHGSIYNKLKHNGGKHRIMCSRCHESFHSYSPVRQNWNEIMPKCSQCHQQPHGPKQTDCLKCHQEPHTPLNVPYTGYLLSVCGDCHASPAEQIRKYPSAHTEQGCDGCHASHGEIPSCMDCHEPHVPDQPLEACKSCHPVHKPLEITYSEGNANTCNTCHSGVYDEWSHTQSKHGKVDCAACHVKHGAIPECSTCHGVPHDKRLLAKFPKCLECHINVHDLPVK